MLWDFFNMLNCCWCNCCWCAPISVECCWTRGRKAAEESLGYQSWVSDTLALIKAACFPYVFPFFLVFPRCAKMVASQLSTRPGSLYIIYIYIYLFIYIYLYLSLASNKSSTQRLLRRHPRRSAECLNGCPLEGQPRSSKAGEDTLMLNQK